MCKKNEFIVYNHCYMMKKILCFSTVLFLSLSGGAVITAGERTVPVDIFILVDKSLSMEESKTFPDLKKWTDEQLTGQMLVEGDWLTIYQFYGKAENVLTLTINNDEDKARVKEAFDSIIPDGKFTDIGLALDTIKASLDKRLGNGRYKIMLLLTDLRQEAPWTSKYPGTIDPFKSPYLAEARTVDHGGWYEITLDMDIHDQVVTLSRELFKTIETLEGTSHETLSEGQEYFDVQTSGETAVSMGTGATTGGTGTISQGNYSAETVDGQVVRQNYTEGGTGIARMIDTGIENPQAESADQEQRAAGGGFNIPANYLYIGGVILLLLLLIVVIGLIRSRKPSDDKKNPAKAVDLMDSNRWDK